MDQSPGTSDGYLLEGTCLGAWRLGVVFSLRPGWGESPRARVYALRFDRNLGPGLGWTSLVVENLRLVSSGAVSDVFRFPRPGVLRSLPPWSGLLQGDLRVVGCPV